MTNIFNIRYTRNGGMRFLRIGKLCFSFCVTSKPFKPARKLVFVGNQDAHFQAYLENWNAEFDAWFERSFGREYK